MLESLIKPASDIIGKFVKDKDLQAKLDHELQTLFHQANMAQIEILKEGAAATYGSDAIAGVVNFITDSNFEGLKVNLAAKGMTGAAILSTCAALRSGAGLTITTTPSSLNYIYETIIPYLRH